MGTGDFLGPLEAQVMQAMWEVKQATVREVVEEIGIARPLAYTTIMTIMNNLTKKGLLKRALRGKAYVYTVALTPGDFLKAKSKEAVSDVLSRFGDLAVARFVEVLAEIKPEELERLHRLADPGRPRKPEKEAPK